MDLPGLKILNDRLRTVLGDVYEGVQTEMKRDLGDWSQSTFNRALELNSSLTQSTLHRHNRRIAEELVDAGVVRSEFLETGQKPIQPEKTVAGASKGVVSEMDGEVVQLPRVSFKASAGDGSYVTEQEYEGTYIIDPSELKGVRPSELRDGMFVIEAEGDSMIPDIHPGEQLIIKPVEAPDRIASDAIYLFRLEKRVQIKRLQAFPGGRIRVKSKNTDYDDYELDLDAGHDFEILGLVWGRFERLA